MTRAQRFSYRAKRLVAEVLYRLGVLQLCQAIVLRDRAVVVMYHRVLTAPERQTAASHPALVVDVETFARQMALLRKRFKVIDVTGFAEHLEQQRPFPPSTCIITFDDGWRDNFENALPIMKSLGLPGLIFLPMDYIGRKRVFWQEALVHMVTRAVLEARTDRARRLALAAVLEPAGLAPVLDLPDVDPKPSIVSLVSAQKSLTRAALEGLAQSLAGVMNADLEAIAATDGFMGWPEVDEMARHGISFGGHGVHHLLLTQASDAEAAAEITGSKATLDARLSEPVPTFSYPNGYFTRAVVDKVKAAGYRLAFIAQGGPVRCTDDRWILTRVNIHQAMTDTDALFLARLVGLF